MKKILLLVFIANFMKPSSMNKDLKNKEMKDQLLINYKIKQIVSFARKYYNQTKEFSIKYDSEEEDIKSNIHCIFGKEADLNNIKEEIQNTIKTLTSIKKNNRDGREKLHKTKYIFTRFIIPLCTGAFTAYSIYKTDKLLDSNFNKILLGGSSFFGSLAYLSIKHHQDKINDNTTDLDLDLNLKINSSLDLKINPINIDNMIQYLNNLKKLINNYFANINYNILTEQGENIPKIPDISEDLEIPDISKALEDKEVLVIRRDDFQLNSSADLSTEEAKVVNR